MKNLKVSIQVFFAILLTTSLSKAQVQAQPQPQVQAQAKSNPTETTLVEMVSGIPQVKDTAANIQFCFQNEEFRNDLTQSLGGRINTLQQMESESVITTRDEVCIRNSPKIINSEEYIFLSQLFSKNAHVTLAIRYNQSQAQNAEEFSKLQNPEQTLVKNTSRIPPSQNLSQNPSQNPSQNSDSSITIILRGALAGLGGAAFSKASRPLLDYVTNVKEPGRFVNIPTAALIGATIDYLQTVHGEKNDERRYRNDAAAVFITNLFRFKDQNTYQLGLVMTLTSLPAVDQKLQAQAANFPREINWAAHLALLGAVSYRSRHEKGARWRDEFYDKGIGFGTYAFYGYGLSDKFDNPNYALLGTGLMVALDELNDKLPGSGGNFSYRDAAYAYAGALFGVFLYQAKIIPKNWAVQLYGKTFYATFRTPL